MNIKFGKKDIIEMVEKYYKEILDISGKVSITCSKQLVGYGMAEHNDCVVTFKLKGQMSILDKKRDIEIDVSEDEVMAAIEYYVEKEGYNYTGYRMLRGMNPKVTGCLTNERTEYTPYFNGIEVGVTNENFKKIINK